MAKYVWTKNDDSAWTCEMPGNVTLVAVPDRTVSRQFKIKPARGTKWRAACNVWDGKSTISRFGRDAYFEMQDNATAAMRLAERIYEEVASA